MYTNSIAAAGIAVGLLMTGGAATVAAPAAHAEDHTCFVDVAVVERGESEIHFGFKAHCTDYVDTVSTETRLWRADTRDGTPQEQGKMRPETFGPIVQDFDKAYTFPCKAGAPVGYWHAEVKFTAQKGFAKDSDTVISTEPAPPISC